MSYAAFEAETARVNDILCAVNLLTWDARTQMPPGGVESRGRQIATLTSLAREMATGEAMTRAIEAARGELADTPAYDTGRRAVESAAAGIGTLARIPAALVEEAADLKTRAQAQWVAARTAQDFSSFAPVLERTLDIQRAMAEAIGFDDHPYDALVALYEPGMTWARLRKLYDDLKAELIPLTEAALATGPARTEILERSYPVERQKAFSRVIAERMGYDFTRGRLDDTVHPFEISFTRNDVRITGRFKENWLPGGLFAVWHEAGHGMYEQGIDPAFTRSAFTTDFANLYAVGGASFGTHESQSRLWENRVGRSQRFWDLHYGALVDTFPEQLADVPVEDFWRAVNAARPSLIRVEADELTYDLHIILRSEIEAGLMAGEIRVRDLPQVWAEKMKAYLGLDVPNDTAGVLQDVHWSSGMVGSFPTYTIGNIMAAQFFKVAGAVSDVERGLDAGDYRPLHGWLHENVHRHGRSRTPEELLVAATGSTLDIAPYVETLREKVAALGR